MTVLFFQMKPMISGLLFFFLLTSQVAAANDFELDIILVISGHSEFGRKDGNAAIISKLLTEVSRGGKAFRAPLV